MDRFLCVAVGIFLRRIECEVYERNANVTTADAKDEHENESEGSSFDAGYGKRIQWHIVCETNSLKWILISGPRVPLARISLFWGVAVVRALRVDEPFLLVGSMTGWRIWPCAGMCLIVIRTPSWYGCYCSAWFDEKEGWKKRIYGLGLAESRFTGRRIMVGLLWDVGVSALVLGKSCIKDTCKRVVLYVFAYARSRILNV